MSIIQTRIGDPYSAYSTQYGSHSGSGYSNCCPLVVDPLIFTALVGFMFAAVYLLQTVIDMSALPGPGRRKKRSVLDVFIQGKATSQCAISPKIWTFLHRFSFRN